MASYSQIKQQIADLERKASLVRKSEVSKVVAGIKKQIAQYDLTADDLGLTAGKGQRAGDAPKRVSRTPSAPKYRDPSSGKTWNGHGKRPLWFVEAEKKGKVATLLIDQAVSPKKVVTPKAKSKPVAKKIAVKPAKAPVKAAVKSMAKAPAKVSAKAAAVKTVKAKPSAVKKPAGKKPMTQARVGGAVMQVPFSD